jgi:hypothetical protein
VLNRDVCDLSASGGRVTPAATAKLRHGISVFFLKMFFQVTLTGFPDPDIYLPALHISSSESHPFAFPDCGS